MGSTGPASRGRQFSTSSETIIIVLILDGEPNL
jgi:hypothetical protein